MISINMKKCPYCLNLIEDDAINCQFCHRRLESAAPLPPPAKKKRGNRAVAILLILSVSCISLILVYSSGALGLKDKARSVYNQIRQYHVEPVKSEVPIQGYSIQYIVYSTGTNFHLTYADDQSDTIQEDASTDQPWKRNCTMQWGNYVYVWAQSQVDADVRITCRIVVNGEVWREDSSYGKNAAATCSGTLGEP